MAMECTEDVEMEVLSQQELEDKPWKYIGYRGFSRYVSRSDDFFTLRRFDRIHRRVLLTKQDRIAKLEEDLDVLEQSLGNRNTEPEIDNGTVRNDQNQERKRILQDLEDELKKYDDILVNYMNLKSRPRAAGRVVRNIRTWLENNNHPIEPKEIEFLKADDLISASATTKSSLRHLFEQWVLCPTLGLFGVFLDKSVHHTQNPEILGSSTVYGRDEPVDAFASVSIFIVAFAMLILPLWILFTVDDMFKRLGVITVFITVLLGVLTSATLAKPFEILAATAGYSAVLVVFLQIGTNTEANVPS